VDGSLRVRCACGWEVVGVDDEVVEATQEHGRRMHNMAATRDQVLAMAVGTARGGSDERTIPRPTKPGAR
jgi:predicted small metal-binding protein